MAEAGPIEHRAGLARPIRRSPIDLGRGRKDAVALGSETLAVPCLVDTDQYQGTLRRIRVLAPVAFGKKQGIARADEQLFRIVRNRPLQAVGTDEYGLVGKDLPTGQILSLIHI